MADKVETILNELDYQKGIRRKSDDLRWQAFAIVKHRTEMFSIANDCPIKHEHLYDMAGVKAFDTFIAGFMDAFTPPNQQWFSIRLKSRSYRETLPSDYGIEYTDYVRNAMRDEIEHSNYYDQRTLASKDMVCGGYSCKLIQNNPKEKRIFCNALEPWRCYFDKDLHGNWNLFFYEYYLTGRELIEKFPNLDRNGKTYSTAKDAPKKIFKMVYVITERKRIVDSEGNIVRFSKAFRRKMRYAVLEICVDTKEILLESGSTYFPVVIHVLQENGDSQYGCGIIMKHIEEFSKLNRVAYEYGLVIAKINHAPFFVPPEQMEDFSNDPEARVAMQANGLNAQRIEDPVDLNAASDILVLQQNVVRELLYNSLFSFLTSSDKVYTATQVNALHSESYSKLAPLYGTIQCKDLDPTLRMIMKIMIDNDRLEVDTEYIGESAKTKLEFLFDSAMAQAMQAYTNVNAANITLDTLAVLMNMGITSVADNIDFDDLMRNVMYSGGAPASFYIDRRKMEADREARRKAAQEQLDIENNLKRSEINRNNAGAANLNNSAGFNGGME